MALTVYYASVSGSMELRKKQDRIFSILESKGYQHERVDITVTTELKDSMRTKCKNPKALPPQIFNGDAHCGDFEAFENAIEMEQLEEFLKLKK